ncbi:hypothetical protein KCP74_09490 [Salmonella enterica subsp. enterica]|nr:hypothetical protein KCP74_09490 [Salmonella enterica subsp. enterica]
MADRPALLASAGQTAEFYPVFLVAGNLQSAVQIGRATIFTRILFPPPVSPRAAAVISRDCRPWLPHNPAGATGLDNTPDRRDVADTSFMPLLLLIASLGLSRNRAKR